MVTPDGLRGTTWYVIPWQKGWKEIFYVPLLRTNWGLYANWGLNSRKLNMAWCSCISDISGWSATKCGRGRCESVQTCHFIQWYLLLLGSGTTVGWSPKVTVRSKTPAWLLFSPLWVTRGNPLPILGKCVTDFGERHVLFFWEKQARLLVAVLNAKNVGVWILEVLGLGVSEK